MIMNDIILDSIEEGIEDIKLGKLLIVVDDEDRENEGDFICSAELITPEIVNFMAKHGRGLICAALPEERCEALDLNLMVGNNTSIHETQFTVTVDLLNEETSTGVSAFVLPFLKKDVKSWILTLWLVITHQFMKPNLL